MATTTSKKVSNGGLLKVVETKVDCNYSAVEGVQIDKVLDNYATCEILQVEKINEMLDIAGRVHLTSVFVDAEKNVHSNVAMVDFAEKIQIMDADAIVVIPKVKNIKARKETSVFVDCTICMDLEIYGVCQENVNYIEPNSNNLTELTEEICVDSLLCFNNSQIDQSETVELDQGAEMIAVYSNLSINKVTPNGNYVTIDAEIVRDIVYSVDGVIKKVQKRSDITEEISLLNCTTETPCTVRCAINSNKFESTVNADAKTVVNVSTTVAVAIWGYERQKIDVIKDAYSVTKKLNLSTETVMCSNYKKVITATDSLNVVKNMASAKRIDEVLFVGSNYVRVDSTAVVDGNVVITGTITQNVIGKNYDNDDIFNTVVESEFKTTVGGVSDTENLDYDYIVEANCQSIKNKAGQEIAINYNIDVQLNTKSCKTEYFVNEIEEVGDVEPSEYSIFIYKPEPNERVFDIAKRLAVTPDCVLSQNPEIVDGQPIERVVLYKKKAPQI